MMFKTYSCCSCCFFFSSFPPTYTHKNRSHYLILSLKLIIQYRYIHIFPLHIIYISNNNNNNFYY
eukprot:UN02658